MSSLVLPPVTKDVQVDYNTTGVDIPYPMTDWIPAIYARRVQAVIRVTEPTSSTNLSFKVAYETATTDPMVPEDSAWQANTIGSVTVTGAGSANTGYQDLSGTDVDDHFWVRFGVLAQLVNTATHESATVTLQVSLTDQ